MVKNDFRILSEKLFQLGKYSVCLQTLLGEQALARTRKKFSNVSDATLVVLIRELVRFLFLSAQSPASLFFPGDQLIDDVWHSFMIETVEYRDLCSRLRPGCFIEHSGMRYENYAETKSAQQLHEEQLSWLVSYIKNFGHISEDAFHHLLLAQELVSRFNLNLITLNQMATRLCQEAQNQVQLLPFNLESFLDLEILPNAASISEDSLSLKHALLQIFEGRSMSSFHTGQNLLSNEELELVYAASTALGFTMWQHLAAVERLIDYPQWQEKNATLWKEIAASKKLIGLGTTHLAHFNSSARLSSSPIGDGFSLSGILPWVSGAGIFDYILLAFEGGGGRLFLA